MTHMGRATTLVFGFFEGSSHVFRSFLGVTGFKSGFEYAKKSTWTTASKRRSDFYNLRHTWELDPYPVGKNLWKQVLLEVLSLHEKWLLWTIGPPKEFCWAREYICGLTFQNDGLITEKNTKNFFSHLVSHKIWKNLYRCKFVISKAFRSQIV